MVRFNLLCVLNEFYEIYSISLSFRSKCLSVQYCARHILWTNNFFISFFSIVQVISAKKIIYLFWIMHPRSHFSKNIFTECYLLFPILLYLLSTANKKIWQLHGTFLKYLKFIQKEMQKAWFNESYNLVSKCQLPK